MKIEQFVMAYGIEQDRSVIGTLYALGLRRGDLLRHYLTLPVLICFAAGGIVGVGTLVTAFGFGPFIAAFNRVVSPMIGKAPAEV